ncbi:MAG: hypothetical protein WCB97_06235 [Thiobacillus sp.]
MRLYNEARDKQGEAATKAWSEVDLKTYFQSQRDERKKLLQAELDSITLHTMTRRENTMRVVALGTVKKFDTNLKDELSNLVDGNIQQLAEWNDANRALTLRRKNLTFSRDLLSLHDPGLSNCAAALKSSPISPEKANDALNAFKESCIKEKDASKKVAGLEKTIGGAYWLAFEEEAKLVSEAKKNADEKTNEYKAALKAYEDAVNSDPLASAKPSEKIADLAGKLRKALDALLKLQDKDKFGFAKEAVAKEKVNTLDELLEKVESGAEPGKDAGRTEIQALMVPKIADDLQAINALNKTTPKAALIIRRDIEKGRADAAALEVSYVEQRVVLSKSILASRFEEALLIWRAQKELEPVMKYLPEDIYTEALSKASPELKASLLKAAGYYLDAIGRQRSHTQRLETMKTAIAHERSIGYAENSTGQWASLIGSVVGQASEYAAGGQKFSEYKDLVQSLTLLWIGSGVNK